MKRKKKGVRSGVKDVLSIDESIRINRKRGNGVLRRQIWVNAAGKVTRYSLAYINYSLFHGDNGRVLGYDNAHDYHHRHFMGEVSAIKFTSFEEIEDRFREEYEVLHAKIKTQ